MCAGGCVWAGGWVGGVGGRACVCVMCNYVILYAHTSDMYHVCTD